MRVLLTLLFGLTVGACAGSATMTNTTTSSGPQGTTQTTSTTHCSRSAGMPLPPGCSNPPDYYSANVYYGRATYYSPSRVYSGHPRYYPREWGYGGYYTTRDSSGGWVQRQYVPRR